MEPHSGTATTSTPHLASQTSLHGIRVESFPSIRARLQNLLAALDGVEPEAPDTSMENTRESMEDVVVITTEATWPSNSHTFYPRALRERDMNDPIAAGRRVVDRSAGGVENVRPRRS